MAKIKTEYLKARFGPERKKLGLLRSSLMAGGETIVPDELVYILEKGTYTKIREKKVETPKKEIKKPKKTKKINKEEKASLEDLNPSYIK